MFHSAYTRQSSSNYQQILNSHSFKCKMGPYILGKIWSKQYKLRKPRPDYQQWQIKIYK